MKQQDGYDKAKIGSVFIQSCYASPNIRIEGFEEFVDNLVRDASYHKQVIIGGDFNAWAVEQGSQKKILFDAFPQLTCK